ncbi:hypothetical protein [Paenibacillus lactis]|nr:hypothetical protein [Paenibacillus lactis]
MAIQSLPGSLSVRAEVKYSIKKEALPQDIAKISRDSSSSRMEMLL